MRFRMWTPICKTPGQRVSTFRPMWTPYFVVIRGVSTLVSTLSTSQVRAILGVSTLVSIK